MESGFNLDITDIIRGLTEFEVMSRAALEIYGDTAGKKLEAEAKRNAPWTDRTGLSRKSIKGGSQWEGNKCIVYLSGNTAQFPFLELAHDKKYAVLQPTINRMAPDILRGLKILFK